MKPRTVATVLAIAVACSSAATGAAAAPITRRASVSASGAQSPNGGIYESISGSGRFVAFETASRLTRADANGETDVFVRDMREKTTERVSVSSSGREANDSSGYAAISANGRFVSFVSEATNLVRGDRNEYQDIFVHDRRTGATTRVSVSSRGREGNGHSASTTISADGRFVAFTSAASNLVPGDGNGVSDLFLHDLRTGRTERIGVSSSGEEPDAAIGDLVPGTISADGRRIAFHSAATNLVPNDTNAMNDVFVHDRIAGTTRRVSVSSTGTEGDGPSRQPSISGDGRSVAFVSFATNLVGNDTNGVDDAFVRNVDARTTVRVSVAAGGGDADDGSYYPSLSFDGRFVAFHSFAEDLVAADTNGYADVFVRDRRHGRTRLASVSRSGEQGNSASEYAFISSDGRYVAFQSEAMLIDGDTNGATDIYVRGPLR